MTRKMPPPPARRKSLAKEAAQEDDNGLGRVVLRPDGYYWQTSDGEREDGPFDSRAEAWTDLGEADEESPEPGETLREAEDEIGISDWIDPETGQPAEGQSLPRLDD